MRAWVWAMMNRLAVVGVGRRAVGLDLPLGEAHGEFPVSGCDYGVWA